MADSASQNVLPLAPRAQHASRSEAEGAPGPCPGKPAGFTQTKERIDDIPRMSSLRGLSWTRTTFFRVSSGRYHSTSSQPAIAVPSTGVEPVLPA
jgi:hypothetical protein